MLPFPYSSVYFFYLPRYFVELDNTYGETCEAQLVHTHTALPADRPCTYVLLLVLMHDHQICVHHIN
jgi:hypothetical protein